LEVNDRNTWMPKNRPCGSRGIAKASARAQHKGLGHNMGGLGRFL
jgi:hypothetical protein